MIKLFTKGIVLFSIILLLGGIIMAIVMAIYGDNFFNQGEMFNYFVFSIYPVLIVFIGGFIIGKIINIHYFILALIPVIIIILIFPIIIILHSKPYIQFNSEIIVNLFETYIIACLGSLFGSQFRIVK